MFSRFSPAAKRVLRSAEQACRNHNHYYVGVGHLLLALVEENDPGVNARLREADTHPADVINDVRRALGTGEDRLWDGILITPRVRNIVGIAERAAPEGAIEPGHLLDAIVAEGGGLAAEILARFQGNTTMTQRVGG